MADEQKAKSLYIFPGHAQWGVGPFNGHGEADDFLRMEAAARYPELLGPNCFRLMMDQPIGTYIALHHPVAFVRGQGPVPAAGVKQAEPDPRLTAAAEEKREAAERLAGPYFLVMHLTAIARGIGPFDTTGAVRAWADATVSGVQHCHILTARDANMLTEYQGTKFLTPGAAAAIMPTWLREGALQTLKHTSHEQGILARAMQTAVRPALAPAAADAIARDARRAAAGCSSCAGSCGHTEETSP